MSASELGTNMLRVATIVTVALGVILTSSGVTAAAQPVPRVLRWGAAVDGAVAPGGARTYRLFEETDELSLTFTFFNQSSDSLSADLREFGKGVKIQVRSDRLLPIETDWNNAIRLSGESFDSPVDAIRLPPQTGFGWTVKIHRRDGATFSTGTYEVTLSIADALRSLRENESQAWTGRAVEMTELHIAIAPPSSNEERAQMYRASAMGALIEHRPEDAVKLFGRALDALPSDTDALSGLGHAYLSANRYREAITVYERVLALRDGRRGGVPLLLALSYVAVGDEPNATRVLRFEGRSETNISEEIRRLREQVKRRAAR